MSSMVTKERLSWIVPIAIGASLTAAVIFGGEALGWSDGGIGTASLAAVLLGVWIRLAMLDHASRPVPKR